MKTPFLLASALCATLASVSAAHAVQVDISGSNYSLGTPVAAGQFGNINTNPISVGSNTGYDLANGSLPTGDKIVFTYNFSGLSSGQLSSIANYLKLATVYTITNTNGTSLATATTGMNQTSVSPASLPVFITSNVSGTTGTTTIENNSGVLVNFASYFESAISGLKGICATYNVSAVPLPQSLVLFATALMGLLGYSRFRKIQG